MLESYNFTAKTNQYTINKNENNRPIVHIAQLKNIFHPSFGPIISPGIRVSTNIN